MIHKISNFRIYAALDYDMGQLWSMRETIPSFPFYEILELVNISKKPINKNWENTVNINIKNNTRVKIGNFIKMNQYGVGIYRLIGRAIKNDQ